MDGLEDAGDSSAQHHLSQARLRAADSHPLTADDFRNILNEQLNPIRDDIHAIKTHGVSQADLKSTIAPINAAIEDITARLESLEARDSRAPTPGPTSARTASEASVDTIMQTKLQELEREVQLLKHHGGPRASADVHNKRSVTAVFGNLDGFDMFNTAAAWLKDQLATLSGPTPQNLYIKGDTNHILYAEFGNTLDRDTAVALIRSASLQRNGKTIWASPDRRPTDRAARNFCFGLKYMLKEHMNMQFVIKVNDEMPFQVHVGGELALTVTTTDTSLKREWANEWGQWDRLQKHEKLKELTAKCDDLVSRASTGMKGGPKGNSKGAGRS